MILRVQNVTRQFGGLTAVKAVSFELAESEILGLLGPNGAGKTTLFNCINGVYPPSSGRVYFRDQDVTGLRPYHLARLGMARTHQIVRPLNELSVHDNVVVGACYGREGLGLAAARRVAAEVLELVGLLERSNQLAGSLNVAQKKRLEMARALAGRPHLLLLDEVLAGLNAAEIAGMLDTIRQVRDQGVTILMIEHIMQAIMNLSHRILVLNYGELIATGTPAQVAANPIVIEAYLGDPEVAARLLEGESRDGAARNP